MGGWAGRRRVAVVTARRGGYIVRPRGTTCKQTTGGCARMTRKEGCRNPGNSPRLRLPLVYEQSGRMKETITTAAVERGQAGGVLGSYALGWRLKAAGSAGAQAGSADGALMQGGRLGRRRAPLTYDGILARSMAAPVDAQLADQVW